MALCMACAWTTISERLSKRESKRGESPSLTIIPLPLVKGKGIKGMRFKNRVAERVGFEPSSQPCEGWVRSERRGGRSILLFCIKHTHNPSVYQLKLKPLLVLQLAS
jgi:hypothetical protein